ncbi:MAG: hypothetical protein ACRCTA_00740 [Bacilli bacterium]
MPGMFGLDDKWCYDDFIYYLLVKRKKNSHRKGKTSTLIFAFTLITLFMLANAKLILDYPYYIGQKTPLIIHGEVRRVKPVISRNQIYEFRYYISVELDNTIEEFTCTGSYSNVFPFFMLK